MTPEQIKQKVLKYQWEPWIARPFGAFILSLFRGGSRKWMKKIVGMDVEWRASLFQRGQWYKSEKAWDEFEEDIAKEIKKGASAYDIVRKCEQYQKNERKHIEKLIKEKKPVMEKFKELTDVLVGIISFVWLAHGLEHLYVKKLRGEVPKFYSGDIEKYIGDVSYPKKKNEHSYFVEELAGHKDLKEIREKFAWIKVRDGFSEGFTIEELKGERERIKKEPGGSNFKRPKFPKELKELVEIAQELVYLRTLRTDILYELMYRARPILMAVADKYGIDFSDMRHYDFKDLAEGNLRKYSDNISMADLGGEVALFNGPILEEEEESEVMEFKGNIAFKGKIQGIAKVVMNAHQIGKVNEGDILIAPTTAPSYIVGMGKASAFVTDEGGITSHTAIVAREMKKPCIIGTKIATKVLKDGDLVEVDAERGIVKKLN
ncbi:MAG TPA: PEP-utilizing enzyme [Candidatus Paceibacterota bacterium]